MNIKSFVFNPFGENTYIIWDENSKDAAIIDPGCHNDKEKSTLSSFIADNELKIKQLLNTHMHIDHCAGNAFIEKKFGVATSCNLLDTYLANAVNEQAQMFGFPYHDGISRISNNLSDNEIIEIAEADCKVLHIPGHSKGHLAYYLPKYDIVFAGDALFRMSIGRTDLPGGNYNELINSIEEKLLTLPRQTVVMPGHGIKTTIGDELQYNPFL